MCGIFGFMLKKPLSMTKVMKVLQKLEVSKYPDEKLPVGGYGAGVAVLLDDGGVVSEKVGKNGDSPVSAANLFLNVAFEESADCLSSATATESCPLIVHASSSVECELLRRRAIEQTILSRNWVLQTLRF